MSKINVKNWIVSTIFAFVMVGVLSVGAITGTVSAQEPTSTTETAQPRSDTSESGCGGFLGFPAWYDGLTDDNCEVKSPSDFGSNGLSYFIWKIALNVVQIGLMMAGYVSVGFILYGGFLLITGRGKPDEIASGQITVRNAVIGFVISFGAVVVVKFAVEGLLGAATVGDGGIQVIDSNVVLKSVLNMVYFAAGITAVITIIVAGYVYVISGGAPAEVAKSKNAILYAVIGLIVIAMAFIVTQFIIGSFK